MNFSPLLNSFMNLVYCFRVFLVSLCKMRWMDLFPCQIINITNLRLAEFGWKKLVESPEQSSSSVQYGKSWQDKNNFRADRKTEIFFVGGFHARRQNSSLYSHKHSAPFQNRLSKMNRMVVSDGLQERELWCTRESAHIQARVRAPHRKFKTGSRCGWNIFEGRLFYLEFWKLSSSRILLFNDSHAQKVVLMAIFAGLSKLDSKVWCLESSWWYGHTEVKKLSSTPNPKKNIWELTKQLYKIELKCLDFPT